MRTTSNSKKKKILFVIPSLEIGGVSSSLVSLYDNLKDDFSISVYALTHDGDSYTSFSDEIVPKNKVLDAIYCNIKNKKGINKLFALYIKIIKRFCKIINIDIEQLICKNIIKRTEFNYDILVAFQEGCATKFVSMITHPNKIAWVHCNYRNYNSTNNELFIYEKYKKIVCVSRYTAEIFKNVYASLSANVLVIYNILNEKKIQTMSLEQVEDANLHKDTFTIISIGRFAPVKRFHLIPDIARVLLNNDIKFQWIIIGPNYGDTYYNNFILSLEDPIFTDSVVYLGPKSNPYPYLKNSDLLVVLSESEACPMIFNEAKILGVPVVSTDFGSVSEFIEDGHDGRVASVNDLARIILETCNDSSIYDSLKYNILTQHYSNQIVLRELICLFDNI